MADKNEAAKAMKNRRFTRIYDEERESRRNSIFEVNNSRRPTATGNSVVTCNVLDEDDVQAFTPKKQVHYENTFRMEPYRKFNVAEVQRIMTKSLEDYLTDLVYSPELCAGYAKDISNDIRFKVKELRFDRFKIVCHVVIGQKNDTSVRIGTRCLWDTTLDNFVSASFENATMYAVANVYGCYYE